jgi:hypothetical protein
MVTITCASCQRAVARTEQGCPSCGRSIRQLESEEAEWLKGIEERASARKKEAREHQRRQRQWLKDVEFRARLRVTDDRKRTRRRRQLALTYPDCVPWKAEILSDALFGGGVFGLVLVLVTAAVALLGGFVSLMVLGGIMRLMRVSFAVVPRSAFLIFSVPLALVAFNLLAPFFYKLQQLIGKPEL